MRILICDDDALIIEQLQKYIRNFFENISVKCPELVCFSDGESLLADKGEKDILFLDIEMPGMNGIYVGKELKKKNDKIIIFIVTSYSEYLDDAMRFHVFRYLSKPLAKQRFFRNMKDAVDLYNTMTVKIPVETKQGVHTLPASSVIAVEAQGRKVTVHTTLCDFESIHNIQYWLELLPKNRFFQTHPTEKTCRAMRFIFYPVLRVTVRIDMDQYHFIFFAEFHFPADTMLSELVYSIIPFFHTGGCYGNE